MKHLSGLDAAFLHVESPEMPMHVGSLNVMRLPDNYQGDFFEDVKAHVAGRMHLADLFTRKLALMPFDMSDPVWVDDDDIDLDYHMRHITLPKPGTNRQLQQYVARLHSSLLDRSRPLWEFFIIDGLKSGEVALYTKAHHAGMDGQAGIAVAQAIFDMQATGRVVRAARPKVKRGTYQLGFAELAVAALQNTARQAVNLAKLVPSLAQAAKDTLAGARREGAKIKFKLPQFGKMLAPRTMLNVAITNQRSFAGRTVSMAEVKQIAKRTGTSVNDVVLASVGGALQRFFKELGTEPEKSLVAAVPVSLREAGDATANNQASMVLMGLASTTLDPVQRIQEIHAASAATKARLARFKSIIPTDFPIIGAPWLISGAASMLGRSRIVNVLPPVANVVISNVPGPNFPMFFAGAELTSYYPVSIPAHGIALNVTVQSYNGRLDYGLIACRKVLPDVADLGDLIIAEHKKLLDAALAMPEPQAPAVSKSPVAETVSPGPVAAAQAGIKKRIARAKAKSPELKLVASTAAAEPAKPLKRLSKRAA